MALKTTTGSAGQTIYVVVSSADGSTIPTYNLHVRFQHS